MVIIMESCTVTIILLSERSQRVQKGEGGGGGAGSLSNAHYQSHHKTADQRMIFFLKTMNLYGSMYYNIYSENVIFRYSMH